MYQSEINAYDHEDESVTYAITSTAHDNSVAFRVTRAERIGSFLGDRAEVKRLREAQRAFKLIQHETC